MRQASAQASRRLPLQNANCAPIVRTSSAQHVPSNHVNSRQQREEVATIDLIQFKYTQTGRSRRLFQCHSKQLRRLRCASSQKVGTRLAATAKATTVAFLFATLFIAPSLTSSSTFVQAADSQESFINSSSLPSLLIFSSPTSSNEVENPTSASSLPPQTTPPDSSTTKSTPDQDANSDNNDATTGGDDYDASGGSLLSNVESNETKNATQLERLVSLQTSLKKSARNTITSILRDAMIMSDTLTLSGQCSAATMSLVYAASETKSFAFKFFDASAKLPSGLMYGLLSDFGDYDECLSIWSRPDIAQDDTEAVNDAGAYSGKYCLVDAKLDYHIELAPNETVPVGIEPDGVLWDDLLRSYWTGNVSKGFQLAACVPSRCSDDDVGQIIKYIAAKNNIVAQVMSCQDTKYLREQHSYDATQLVIFGAFYALLALNFLGTALDYYKYRGECGSGNSSTSQDVNEQSCCATVRSMLCCFSMRRNWRIFTRTKLESCATVFATKTPELTSSALTASSPLGSAARFSLGGESSGGESSVDVCSAATATTDACTPDYVAPSTVGDSPAPVTHLQQSTSMPVESELRLDLTTPSSTPLAANTTITHQNQNQSVSVAHLSGLKLLLVAWITVGHSFYYPSARNHQYYRSIVRMAFTRDSVWFATTNFTLAIDSLIYITGLLFVYKQAVCYGQHNDQSGTISSEKSGNKQTTGADLFSSVQFIARKILRLWPVYVTVIGLAIVVPSLGDGPMWPEMVDQRLGATCRQNWRLNLLFANNMLAESEMCLPSSWFVSVIMQMFVVGSILLAAGRRLGTKVCLTLLISLLIYSSTSSFIYAYTNKTRAPLTRMDESFVMEQDRDVFRLYTSTFNNLGPFLMGMLGGLLLVKQRESFASTSSLSPRTKSQTNSSNNNKILIIFCETLVAFVAALCALTVLSTVFVTKYTRIEAAAYWALHRVLWSFAAGYVIHKCAIGEWRLGRDLLSLNAFAPLARLIFIVYLVHPIFIHIHTGLVRDGLHVSAYNMGNIYVSRLVLTFATAFVIHLFIEIPLCSLEELFIELLSRKNERRARKLSNLHPLLSKVEPVLVFAPQKGARTSAQAVDSSHNNNKQSPV